MFNRHLTGSLSSLGVHRPRVVALAPLKFAEEGLSPPYVTAL